MPQYEYSVSLKVIHEKFDAKHITEQLSMAPDRYCDAGTERRSRTGELLGGTYDSTIWTQDLTKAKLDAEEVLLEDFIAKKNMELMEHKSFFRDISETGGAVEYFVGWFNSGSINMNIVLEPELMRSTADLGVSIVLCAYPDNE